MTRYTFRLMVLFICLIFFCLVTIGASVLISKQDINDRSDELLFLLTERAETVVIERFSYLSRMDVNRKVNDLFILGKSEVVYHFYDQFTGDRQITYLCVSAAILKEIPVNLLMGLFQWESNFNSRAIYIGSNSIDRGIGQLNSLSFPTYTEE